MEIVYAKEFVIVEHSKASRQLHITWRGYITGEEYILTIRELLRLTQTLGVCSWLCDMRGAEGIREADIRWEESCITGSPYGRHLLRVARLSTSGTAFSKQAAGLHDISITLPEFMEFTSTVKACAWLQELEHNPCMAG